MQKIETKTVISRTHAGPAGNTKGPVQIKAVLFDFDGTLTAPGALDFPAIKNALGCPLEIPVLEFIQSMVTPHTRRAAMERLVAFEIEAAQRSIPNHGAVETVAWIKQRPLACGIITRNSRASVLCALEKFDPLGPGDFDLLVTREDPPAPKPSAEGVFWAARQLNARPREIMMVGDYLFDCQAGRAAGATTVLLDPDNDPRLRAAECDYRIGRLMEIKTLITSSQFP